jgi:hypothetical protein
MDPAPPAPDSQLAVETDDRFPSGPWEGFFLQPMLTKERCWMELTLTFRAGVVTGEGRDRVGTFLVRGRYNLEDGKCWWTKRYLSKHDVHYNGYNEGKGIWGLWELISPPWRGGFHIWPVGMGDPTKMRTATEAEIPAPADPATLPEAEPVGAGVGAGESFEPGAP